MDGIYTAANAIQDSQSIILLLGRNAFRGENTTTWFGSLASSILTSSIVIHWTPKGLFEQLLDDFLRDDKIARQKSFGNIFDLVKKCLTDRPNVHIITDSCSDSVYAFGATVDQVTFLRGSVHEVRNETTTVESVDPKFHLARIHVANSIVRTAPDKTLFICVETDGEAFRDIIPTIPDYATKMYIGTKPKTDPTFRYILTGDPNDIGEAIAKNVGSFV